MSSSAINLAHSLGIHSTVAAVVFAVLYIPLLLWFAFQAFHRPTYVYFYMTLFSAIRIAAFSMRALMATSATAGENTNLVTAYEILYSVGFFGLLYSAFVLALDREELAVGQPTEGGGLLTRILHNRRVLRLILIGAVALGVSGAIKAFSSNPDDRSSGTTMRTVSTVIFLVLSLLATYQALQVLRFEGRALSQDHGSSMIGKRHGARIILAICALLVVREVFLTVTIHNAATQNKEDLWYPLAAVTEILAVILYGTPGLVPPRSASDLSAQRGSTTGPETYAM